MNTSSAMSGLIGWAREKFDTILLLILFAFLIHGNAPEYHEVLGALLLALTGPRNSNPDRPAVPTIPNDKEKRI
jgi:hypothetical protein